MNVCTDYSVNNQLFSLKIIIICYSVFTIRLLFRQNVNPKLNTLIIEVVYIHSEEKKHPGQRNPEKGPLGSYSVPGQK